MLLVTTIISMLALGWVVWITVQRQESGDDAFQAKLDRDDERARLGREATQRPREPDEDPGERSSS